MFPVPNSLSPSRVESFLSCPMQFRFASIEKLPEPPAAHMTKGSLVHRALELLFTRQPAERTTDAALASLADAIAEYRVDPDFTDLQLGEAETLQFFDECTELVHRYLRMENPAAVRDIGLELRLEAPVGALTLRVVLQAARSASSIQNSKFIIQNSKTRAPCKSCPR